MDDNIFTIYKNIVTAKYCSITAICSNQNNSLIICADAYGSIHLIDMISYMVIRSFKAHTSSVNCLETYENILISGSFNSIKLWSLNIINTEEEIKPIYEFCLEYSSDKETTKHFYEVNDMVVTYKDSRLIAATGQGYLHSFDLVSQNFTDVIEVHKNSPLYRVRCADENFLITAGDDGIVSIYDHRDTTKPSKFIKPYTCELLHKSAHAKYISCLILDDTGCIVCGGGPQLALWHLGSCSMITPFIMTGSNPSSTCVLRDKVIGGSSKGDMYQWDFTGRCNVYTNSKMDIIRKMEVCTNHQGDELIMIGGCSCNLSLYERNLLKVMDIPIC